MLKQLRQFLLYKLRPKKTIILDGGYYKYLDSPLDASLQYDIRYLIENWNKFSRPYSFYYYIWWHFIERKKYFSELQKIYDWNKYKR